MPQLVLDNKFSIYYRDDNPFGSPTVLLLHGLGVSSDSWLFQIPALTKAGFRVISPDIRGFGKSSAFNGTINVVTLSEDVRSLIQILQLSPVNLIGISMGGTITLQIVLDDPNPVSRAVLINTFAHLRPKRTRTWLYFFSRFVFISIFGLSSQAHLVARNLFPSPEHEYLRQAFCLQLLQANQKAYRKMIWDLIRFDVRQRLSEIQTPTLIISGEKDSTVPISTQTKLAKAICHSKQIIIPNAGHGVIVEKPDLVNNILLEFLCS